MNVDDNAPVVYCSRCGAEMKSNSRYCMKCGNLNYDHSANQDMRKYIKEENKKSYEVGSGNFIVNDNGSNNVQVSIANNTGNTILCFLVNYGIFLFLLGISFLLCCHGNFSFKSIISSYFPLVMVVLSVIFIYIYAFELIFIKCNRRWWSSFIPVYRYAILSDVIFHKKWLGLLVIVPIVGEIFLLVLFYQLGKKFRYNGLLTILFLVIYIPFMGFGNHLFEGRQFISETEKNSVEKEYKRKRIFFVTCFLVFALGVSSFVYLNQSHVKSGANAVKNYYYVYAGRQFVNRVKEKIGVKEIECYGGAYSPDNGVYYFTYYTVGKVTLLPFYIFREPISGYVKVVNENGQSSFYVSVWDSNVGYEEKLVSELKTDDVLDLERPMIMPTGGNQCKISFYKK